MSNLLQALLQQEASVRAVALSVQEDEQAEFRQIVQGIHDAFEPYAAQVQQLQLLGDYGRAVWFGNRPEHVARVVDYRGLTFRLGKEVSPEELSLRVTARKGPTPAKIELSIQRHHPYKSESLATFEGKTAPEHLLQACFTELIKHLHTESFAKAQAVAA